jgi:hypothetical protein
MQRKKITQEDQFELKTRQLLNRIAVFCLHHFRSIGDVLDLWHLKLVKHSESIDHQPSKYAPFGVMLILAGLYFLIQIDTVFSPTTVIYFFSIIALIGFYIIRRA